MIAYDAGGLGDLDAAIRTSLRAHHHLTAGARLRDVVGRLREGGWTGSWPPGPRRGLPLSLSRPEPGGVIRSLDLAFVRERIRLVVRRDVCPACGQLRPAAEIYPAEI